MSSTSSHTDSSSSSVLNPDKPTAPVMDVFAGTGSYQGPVFVFVYGTLRAGQVNDIRYLKPLAHLVSQTVQTTQAYLVGSAQVRGTLYDMGHYPGLRLHADGMPIEGEVYAIDTALIATLDAIETDYATNPDEYFRRLVLVDVADAALPCVLYEINPSYCLNRKPLVTYDWVEHFAQKQNSIT